MGLVARFEDGHERDWTALPMKTPSLAGGFSPVRKLTWLYVTAFSSIAAMAVVGQIRLNTYWVSHGTHLLANHHLGAAERFHEALMRVGRDRPVRYLDARVRNFTGRGYAAAMHIPLARIAPSFTTSQPLILVVGLSSDKREVNARKLAAFARREGRLIPYQNAELQLYAIALEPGTYEF